MKKTRILWTLIAFAVIASAQPVMTNQTVEAMLSGGVPVPTILTAIKTAENIQLFTSKEFHDRLLKAGASPSVADQIVQTMHDRTYKGAERLEDVRPAPVAVAPARPPVAPTAVAQRAETPAPVVTPSPPAGVPAASDRMIPLAHKPETDATNPAEPGSDSQRVVEARNQPPAEAGGKVVRNISSQGPFGFHCGMTREQVIEIVGQQAVKEDKDGSLTLTTAPKPHPAFEAYVLFISPSQGLLKVVAAGKTIRTNDFGTEVQGAFREIRDAVAVPYGSPKTFDFLTAGSLWNEPRDWMIGLLKKERILSAFWDVRATLPNSIQSIALEARALSTETGYLSLGYEFEGWDKYLDSKKAKAATAF